MDLSRTRALPFPSRAADPRGGRLAARVLVAVALLGAVSSCDRHAPVPAASDPEGKDLVAGAVVAAVEKSGGVRLYRILHVDDMPDPIGHDLHMTAYDPKGATFQEAADLHRDKKLKVALSHLLVQKHLFMTRDHRVFAKEPLTPEHLAPYISARDSRK